nr:MAG TPA: hypothetical protein [Caudoviricetes sp.]
MRKYQSYHKQLRCGTHRRKNFLVAHTKYSKLSTCQLCLYSLKTRWG